MVVNRMIWCVDSAIAATGDVSCEDKFNIDILVKKRPSLDSRWTILYLMRRLCLPRIWRKIVISAWYALEFCGNKPRVFCTQVNYRVNLLGSKLHSWHIAGMTKDSLDGCICAKFGKLNETNIKYISMLICLTLTSITQIRQKWKAAWIKQILNKQINQTNPNNSIKCTK